MNAVHVWRPRRSRFGELVQWDTSEHDWLEGRGEKLYLIAMIDDATSRLLARFVRHDTTEENMKLLWSYLEKFGRPLAFYTDKASMFRTAEKRKRDEPGSRQRPSGDAADADRRPAPRVLHGKRKQEEHDRAEERRERPHRMAARPALVNLSSPVAHHCTLLLPGISGGSSAAATCEASSFRARSSLPASAFSITACICSAVRGSPFRRLSPRDNFLPGRLQSFQNPDENRDLFVASDAAELVLCDEQSGTHPTFALIAAVPSFDIRQTVSTIEKADSMTLVLASVIRSCWGTCSR